MTSDSREMINDTRVAHFGEQAVKGMAGAPGGKARR